MPQMVYGLRTASCTFGCTLRSAWRFEANTSKARIPTAQVTWDRNGNLGKFTNFVNLLNMCGVAVPSGVLRGARRAAMPDRRLCDRL